MNLLSFSIINFFLNAIFMFITCCFLVEIFLRIFRIRQPRIRYFARLIPPFKLIFDIFNYNWHKWALWQGIDPLSCPKGSRIFSIDIGLHPTNFASYSPSFDIFFHLKEGQTFTLSDMIAQFIGSLGVYLLISIFIIGTILSVIKISILIYQYVSYKKAHLTQKTPYPFTIENSSLKKAVEKHKISIVLSSSITSPCSHKKTIFFPSPFIHQLTPKERDAIIAHELEHIFWKDSIINWFLTILSHFFWHIPFFKLWLSRIEKEREHACDQSRYIEGIDLATALKKCANFLSSPSPKTFLCSFHQTQTVVERIENVLLVSQNKTRKTLFSWLKEVLFFLIMISIILGRIWIF